MALSGRGLVLVILVLLMAAACGKKEEAAPAAAPAPAAAAPAPAESTTSAAPSAIAASPAGGVATADGETPGSKLTVTELKRTSGETISLKMTLVNETDQQFNMGYNLGSQEMSTIDYGSVGGIYLIDPVGKKKYFVVRDTEQKCLCSRNLKDLDARASINLWAKFPAPPADVQKIGIVVPKFTPMDDVPISQ